MLCIVKFKFYLLNFDVLVKDLFKFEDNLLYKYKDFDCMFYNN